MAPTKDGKGIKSLINQSIKLRQAQVGRLELKIVKRPVDDWFEYASIFDEDANMGVHECTWTNTTLDSDRA